jgi:alginate O-acetyltransferase complex protein AlgI
VALILAVFLFLKNEHLAQLSSVWLRRWTGQDPALARSFEIVWLGYSYTAFRLLHSLLDKKNNQLPDMALAEFASYVIFFPSFTAGPIDRVQNFIKKLRENLVIDAPRFIAGMERLTIGIFKKFVLADSLALISLSAQNAEQINHTLWGWVILYAYSFRILLDFSGYTDIAIGIGIFAGIQLPENFNKPYLNSNLTQFWNNWHMTLTQWFRAYFFNPLTRALRSARVKIPLPLIIAIGQISTMIIIGLWHGVSWNFVLWGAWHGVGLFIHNRWSTFMKSKQVDVQHTWLRAFAMILNFQFVAIGWIWFVLPSPELGWQYLKLLFGGV